ncbi:MAG TPA: fatty acid desaturase family protein [Aestuariivirgaceae bacterium]|nr:fatty acid desaturase family protein [Aestuariivirgaceae bacterium]
MADDIHPRDYSLTGPLNARAIEAGLANADWYKTSIPRARMKELMQRSDGPATRDTLMWIGLMIVTGGFGAYFWGSLWCVPFFLVYGVLYGSGGDSRWHECGHGTAFKTQWKNDAVYQLACFFMMRNPTVWRWSHSRHHTDTIIVGRDPEIVAMRPPDMLKVGLNFFGVLDVPQAMANMLRYTVGRLNGAEKDFIPPSEWPMVFRVARVWTVIYAAVIAACFSMGSILPLMLVGLPRLYGAWHHLMTGLTQHVGLAEDVLDYRLNCRTVYINPFSRFVYWNMNYHVEHHMFPMVPYHALPELHKEMLADCAPPYRGFWDAYREILPTLLRQLRDPNYFIRRQLPPTARPTPPLPSGATG